MRFPRILSHIFDSESKTVSFGWWVFIVASCGAFLLKDGAPAKAILDPDTWLWCVVISSTLIGGKLVGETVLQARLGGKSVPKEIKPDAPQPASAPPAQ